MSHSHAWPPEHTAPAAAAPAGQPAAKADLVAALALSALPQAFDLVVTALAAVAIFPTVFFGRLSPELALVAGVAVWALAYAVAAIVARWGPAGAGDWRGMGAARLALTVATLAISLLPAAGHAAWAPAGLVLARLVQGLAIGRLGAGRGAEARQGWGIALGIGAILTTVLALALGLAVGRADLLAWGWRYPFLIALALNLAAFAADLALYRMASGAPAVRAHQRPRLATIDGVRLT